MVRVELAALLLSLAAADAAAAPLSFTPLDLAGLGPAAQPNLAFDATRDRFVLSWQARLDDGCAALRVATVDRAGTLGPTQEVARGCNWFVNWGDFPSLAVADNGDWLSFWLQKEGSGTYHYGIRVVRSTDAGQSWSAPLTPHRDGTLSEHGFVAMAPAGRDRMLLIWLDGRDTATAGAHAAHAHEHAHGGDMQLRSAIVDRAGRLHHEARIDGNVCSCCWPDLVRIAADRYLAAYRDRSEDEIRDIRLAEFDGQRWRKGARIHADDWKIAACPTNGAALASRDDQVLVIWPTMPDMQRLAVRAKAVAGGPMVELEVGSSVIGRPDVSADAHGWLLSWLGAGAAGHSVLRVAEWDSDLRERSRHAVVTLPAGRNIGVPRLQAAGAEAMLVWTEVSGPAPEPNAKPPTHLAGRLIRRESGD